MKKFLSILMAAAMLLSVCALSACGGSEEPAPEAEGTEVTEPAEGGDAGFREVRQIHRFILAI